MLSAIGIHGRMGSGKDALAEVLIKEFGFKRIAFGDAVKREAEAAIRNWGCEDLNVFPLDVRVELERAYVEQAFLAPWNKPTSPGMRTVLQWWGTEYRRRQDPNYWIQSERVGKLPKRFVVTDVRFPNEMEFVKSHGGEMWLVERPADEAADLALGDLDHISEQLLTLVGREAFDRTIANLGTLEELWAQVRHIMQPKPKPTSPVIDPALVAAAAAAMSAPGTAPDPADSMLTITPCPETQLSAN